MDEVLTELIDRMQRAQNTLMRLAETAHTLHAKTRYEAKADGMSVARSYVEEYLREAHNG